jgi:hypothetical protein
LAKLSHENQQKHKDNNQNVANTHRGSGGNKSSGNFKNEIQ